MCAVNAVNGQGYRGRKNVGGKYIELRFLQKCFLVSSFVK